MPHRPVPVPVAVPVAVPAMAFAPGPPGSGPHHRTGRRPAPRRAAAGRLGGTRPGSRTAGDRGQALPLLAGALVLVALLGVGLVRLGGAAAERARAHTAADAAALAAVAEGRPGADRTADANGGRVTSYVESGGSVEVTVRVGDHEAVARARAVW